MPYESGWITGTYRLTDEDWNVSARLSYCDAYCIPPDYDGLFEHHISCSFHGWQQYRARIRKQEQS